jgi:uncharacterized membrane protein AbrB (regulator of aidB expression)
MKNNHHCIPEMSRLLAVVTAGTITSMLVEIGLSQMSNNNNNINNTTSFLCSLAGVQAL